jgi:predicted protein tyrosine phosphatase
MWIQNVAAMGIPKGMYKDPGSNAMLIQISDPKDPYFPDPKTPFAERYQFTFFDVSDSDRDAERDGISNRQAFQIVQLLRRAQEREMNVVVNCMAGLSRSGAVAEIGVMMGFEDTLRPRTPNMRAKRLMMRLIGASYDSSDVGVP